MEEDKDEEDAAMTPPDSADGLGDNNGNVDDVVEVGDDMAKRARSLILLWTSSSLASSIAVKPLSSLTAISTLALVVFPALSLAFAPRSHLMTASIISIDSDLAGLEQQHPAVLIDAAFEQPGPQQQLHLTELG